MFTDHTTPQRNLILSRNRCLFFNITSINYTLHWPKQDRRATPFVRGAMLCFVCVLCLCACVWCISAPQLLISHFCRHSCRRAADFINNLYKIMIEICVSSGYKPYNYFIKFIFCITPTFRWFSLALSLFLCLFLSPPLSLASFRNFCAVLCCFVKA